MACPAADRPQSIQSFAQKFHAGRRFRLHEMAMPAMNSRMSSTVKVKRGTDQIAMPHCWLDPRPLPIASGALCLCQLQYRASGAVVVVNLLHACLIGHSAGSLCREPPLALVELRLAVVGPPLMRLSIVNVVMVALTLAPSQRAPKACSGARFLELTHAVSSWVGVLQLPCGRTRFGDAAGWCQAARTALGMWTIRILSRW
jgi:hypothetical protein